MYAKQREQYTGESSLNQGDNVSNKSNESEIDKASIVIIVRTNH